MTTDQGATAGVAWAELSGNEVLTALGARRAGLSEAEVAERLQRVGQNLLPRSPRRPFYREFAAHFVHLLALLLWVGAVLAWLAAMAQLALAIVAVILINGVFSYWQEYQAEHAVAALQALLPRRVLVRREGVERMVHTEGLVPGDILVLSAGESVPADARLLSAERLRVDTSALTGESRPAPRHAEVSRSQGRQAAELPNLVLAGTAVTAGRGEAVVFATGRATAFGLIAELTQRQAERPSPLQKEIARITRLITVLAVAMGAACFLIGTTLGGLSVVAGFLFAVGIIVANVPEGLLPTITLSLAIAVRRMAARNALIKRLEKVETLGATTVIVTDKTGTLTQNEMTVRRLWAGGQALQVDGLGYEPSGAITALAAEPVCSEELRELLRTAALCCDARLLPPNAARRRWSVLGEPTEAAVLVAAHKAGLGAAELAAWPRLGELPFDSARKRMTTLQRQGTSTVACMKGALGPVLDRCVAVRLGGQVVALDEALRHRASQVHDELASGGLRVLAVAQRAEVTADASRCSAEEIERDMTLLGFVAMEDPPRPAVAAAIAACQVAGVRVLMATGDDGLTAAAIAGEIGLAPRRVVTGAELDDLSAFALDALLASEPALLFARVTPEHKLRLVETLQRRGEVVAVTGDGVNDAPALKRADVGVAMGIAGTDVAREAADMILTDDNFASIVSAIEEGRAVFDNARKFVTYIFASNIPEIVPFVLYVVLRIPLPLTVMQILAVDLGTDILPALALGAEPPEPDIMRRPPRRRSERLLDRATLLRAYGWLGALEALLGLGGFLCAYWLGGWRPGQALVSRGPLYVTATTMSLAGIVACQVGNAMACRSRRRSVLRLGFTSNRPLFYALGAEVALLLALIYVPHLARWFGLAPLGLRHWLVLALFPGVMLLAEEARKAIVMARRGRQERA